MVGDGVIAESYVSYNITWKNPGMGGQPLWDQNKQQIELHSTDLYPDLLYTSASAIATYYKYTSIDQILNLVREINDVIDAKLSTQKQNEALALPAGPEPAANSTVTDKDPNVTPDSQKKADEITVDSTEKSSPDETEKTEKEPKSYTVKVIGDRLRFIDAQSKGYGEISIRYRASNNITKQVGDERLDNAGKIKAIVELDGLLGKRIEFEYSDFNVEDGRNLLVEILPSIELKFKPGESAVVPKSETAADADSRIKNFAKMIKGTRLEKELLDANDSAKAKKPQINN